MRATAFAAIAVPLLLAGCGGGEPLPPPRAEQPTPSVTRYLPVSEQLAVGLVMAPFGWDPDGCVQYQLETPSQPQLKSVFYRTQAGDFSTLREEAACT